MGEPESEWRSVLGSRYCRGSPLLLLLSERHKTLVWRQLWIWLAEAEREVGLTQVSEEAIEELKLMKEVINWEELRKEERKIKHDVMAHNHVYGRLCPKAAGIIHLGATSCYIQDNADCIIIHDCIQHLLSRMATCLSRLAAFAAAQKSVVTVGRTHYQAASLTTVGKRACIWAQDLLVAFNEVKRVGEEWRFRGVKGATGTQDSFLTLFEGDEDKVEELDDLVTKKAGFQRRFTITGQTYTRLQDLLLVNALSVLGSAATKVAMDIRVLQAFGELWEPFEESQIGSSAMPYKKNPMKCERVCSLARELLSKPNSAAQTAALQGLERTLDDSAARRTFIPESLLTAEAILLILQNVFEGLTVREDVVRANVESELPFLALEKALMFLTQHGVDRQQAHSGIRSTALEAKKQEGKVEMAHLLSGSFFDPVRERVLLLSSSPLSFTGRAVSQTEEFLSSQLSPAIQPFIHEAHEQKVQLDV